MTVHLCLASASPVRAQLLRQAGLDVELRPARIDEPALRDALLAEAATPRDIADALAEHKALRVSSRLPDSLVIGADQVLALGTTLLSKPRTRDEARSQLISLRNRTHQLLSAAVVVQQGQPLWRHVGVARLTMRDFSDGYLDSYLDRNWPGIGGCVGGYQLESEGVRLFSRIEGDYFTILGLPLVEVLGFLTQRQAIPA